MYIIGIGLIVLISILVFTIGNLPQLGKAPSGERLNRLNDSPNFKNGKFENLSHTPTLTEGYSMLGILKKQVFEKNPNTKPLDGIPVVKTNLKTIDLEEDVLVWFGHSSYFLQIDGIKLLIDPVFSGHASPFKGSIAAFKGSNYFQVEHLPDIDYLLITHDHYDHLDYKTIKELHQQNKIKTIVCGLGVGSHFEHWGFSNERIVEMDWNETVELTKTIKLHTTPARHFSGRSFIRNNTLWLSYVLETSTKKLFLGGDSGYDSHFKTIGEKHGPFDFALLENGQYNLAWEAIHLLPEQLIQAAIDLQVKNLIPVHSSKFKLAMHPWNEPLEKVSQLHKEQKDIFHLITPKIGEKVNLKLTNRLTSKWWREIIR